MAAKRKDSQPPPQIHPSSDDDSSSEEDEEQYVAKPISSLAKTPKATDRDDNDESEDDSGSDSGPSPNPPTKSLSVNQKPSESEDDSEEEDEEEEEEPEKVEKLKSPVKAPETEPEKKKLKPSEPDQSLSKKSAPAVSRVWSSDDEMTLLRALVEYHSKNGELPPAKDYGSFLSGISGLISFPVTEKQLVNKMRTLKHNFGQKKKKGPNVKISNPHDKAVFEMCTKLFQEGSSKASKKGGLLEFNSDGDTENGSVAGVSEANGAMANGIPTNSVVGDGAARVVPYFHLTSLIEDMINGQQYQSWLKVNNVIAQIGESRAQNLEAKSKMLRIDAVKLRAREEKLKAEVFGFLAEGMTNE
jgi:Protein of unknown function, DUF573